MKCLSLFQRWKIHESCMLAMGSVQQMVVEAVQKGKVQFHLPAFLQSVVLEDMNTSGWCSFCDDNKAFYC